MAKKPVNLIVVLMGKAIDGVISPLLGKWAVEASGRSAADQDQHTEHEHILMNEAVVEKSILDIERTTSYL